MRRAFNAEQSEDKHGPKIWKVKPGNANNQETLGNAKEHREAEGRKHKAVRDDSTKDKWTLRQ